jgi:hypothetical protein
MFADTASSAGGSAPSSAHNTPLSTPASHNPHATNSVAANTEAVSNVPPGTKEATNVPSPVDAPGDHAGAGASLAASAIDESGTGAAARAEPRRDTSRQIEFKGLQVRCLGACFFLTQPMNVKHCNGATMPHAHI